MSNTKRVRATRRVALVAVSGCALLAALAPLSAQQAVPSTKQQRDSAAKADSIKHAGMPGMGGMKMPGMERPGNQKPGTAKPGMKMPGMEKHGMKMPGMEKHGMEMPGMEMPGMGAVDSTQGMQMPGMSVPDPLGVSMERMGSGTTWIPDAVSLPSRHFSAGQWDLMVHGFVFAQFDAQSGPRGGNQFGSLNWGMFMASHQLAGGRFQARTMLSLDPATVTPRGYPLLLQSGEAYHGAPLHDRQHPHDFFMELGAMYERPLSSKIGGMLYVAPSGEPALGPVAFMHRPSAMDNIFAPISHHWQDATHVSFGVLTAGLFTHQWKLEGSVFNGREPDENRWNFDRLKLDSYSGRLSYNPTQHWALSAGYGYLKSPEALAPNESMHRVTASAMYGAAIGSDGQIATTVVWGANKHADHPALSHSVLLESEAILDASNTLLMRAELVQKSAGDLVLDKSPSNFPADRSFNVSALSAGYIRELLGIRGATIGLGAMGTLNVVPSPLQPAYGSRTPLGGVVFLRLRPSRGGAGGMAGMSHEHE
jgi:hypothetical protein